MTVDVPIKYIAMLDTGSFDIKTHNVFALLKNYETFG